MFLIGGTTEWLINNILERLKIVIVLKRLKNPQTFFFWRLVMAYCEGMLSIYMFYAMQGGLFLSIPTGIYSFGFQEMDKISYKFWK